MNNTLMIYLLTSLISFIIITTTITMQPSAQTEQKIPPLQTQQKSTLQQQEQPLYTSPSCGQVITQNVELTFNLNCGDSDGLIVSASDIVIDLNGYTISGPM